MMVGRLAHCGWYCIWDPDCVRWRKEAEHKFYFPTFLSLLPDCECAVRSCPKFLFMWPPWRDGPLPGTVWKTKLFLLLTLLLSGYFITAAGRSLGHSVAYSCPLTPLPHAELQNFLMSSVPLPLLTPSQKWERESWTTEAITPEMPHLPNLPDNLLLSALSELSL